MHTKREVLLDLVKRTTREFEEEDIPLSKVVQRCQRIAYLRDDWRSYIRFLVEMVDLRDSKQYHRFRSLWKRYFPDDEKGWRSLVRRYKEEREIVSNRLSLREDEVWLGVRVIEQRLQAITARFHEVPPPSYRSTFFGDVMLDDNRKRIRARLLEEKEVWQSVLGNIGVAAHHCLIAAEREILFGQTPCSIFEKNMNYIERRLGEIAPEALEQFVAATTLPHSTAEFMSQATLSMRRLLETVADFVYPPSESDLSLGKDKYINRLKRFALEKKTTAGNLLGAEVEDLGTRITRVYKAINKGVHGTIDQFGFNQVLIQTTLVIGDVLRLYDDSVD